MNNNMNRGGSIGKERPNKEESENDKASHGGDNSQQSDPTKGQDSKNDRGSSSPEEKQGNERDNQK